MTKSEKEELFTLRWYLREHWGSDIAKERSYEILGRLLDPSAQPEERPTASGVNQHQLWCPFALTNFRSAPTKGAYRLGYPEGAIVHFTAGRYNALDDEISFQIKNGYTYFVVTADGTIAQNFALDSWGNHAGVSRWTGLGESVSSKLVGIEVQCAGKVTKDGTSFKTWFGQKLAAKEVRTVPAEHNPPDQVKQVEPGHYHKYTEAQEQSLTRLILWLHHNNPGVFSLDLVLGHDEVSGPRGLGGSSWRKNDPGGALSMTMTEFRGKLKGLPYP